MTKIAWTLRAVLAAFLICCAYLAYIGPDADSLIIRWMIDHAAKIAPNAMHRVADPSGGGGCQACVNQIARAYDETKLRTVKVTRKPIREIQLPVGVGLVQLRKSSGGATTGL